MIKKIEKIGSVIVEVRGTFKVPRTFCAYKKMAFVFLG